MALNILLFILTGDYLGCHGCSFHHYMRIQYVTTTMLVREYSIWPNEKKLLYGDTSTSPDHRWNKKSIGTHYVSTNGCIKNSKKATTKWTIIWYNFGDLAANHKSNLNFKTTVCQKQTNLYSLKITFNLRYFARNTLI